MTAGRKPKAAGVEVDSGVSSTAVATRAALADDAELMDRRISEIAPLFVMAGRAQMASFIGNVSDLAMVKSYQSARSLFKEIKDLPYIGPDGQAKRVSSMDEFCKLAFGKGERRMQQLAASFHTLGEDLYEAATLVGFTARDYQALNALPEDAQEAVKLALASDDKQKAVDMVHELAQRLQAAKASVDELQKQCAAKDKVIEKKNKKIDELHEAEEVRNSGTPDEREAAQMEDLRVATEGATAALRQLAHIAAMVTEQPATEATNMAARQALDYVCQMFCDHAHSMGMTLNFEDQVLPAHMAVTTKAAERAQAGEFASKRGSKAKK
jgi:hypothetical protein